MARSDISVERIRQLFDYDAWTGNLKWRVSYSNRIKVGEIAGGIAANGRKYVGLDGDRIILHRVIWAHQKGEWPKHHLAPLAGDYLNTRIENLLEQTPRETAKKEGVRSNNKTGTKGVAWNPDKMDYTVYAYIDGKSKFHSRHSNLEEANAAAKLADAGIFPTEDEKKSAHELKIGRKRWWRDMVRGCRGLHGWTSFEEFVLGVGVSPDPDSRLIPLDKNSIIGPGNFIWSDPDHDHRSGEAKRAANRRAADKSYYRNSHLMRKFGINVDLFREKLIEQNGVCAICGKPETTVQNGEIQPLSVDHCHTTKKVRGLLCTECNTGIGKFRESQELLRSAISYLDKWNGVESKDKVPPGT